MSNEVSLQRKRDWSRRRHRETKAIVDAIKAARGCLDCGSGAALQYHHHLTSDTPAVDTLLSSSRHRRQQGALFQLEGRGHRYRWETIARLVDANLIKATATGDGYLLRFTAAGRELLGA